MPWTFTFWETMAVKINGNGLFVSFHFYELVEEEAIGVYPLEAQQLVILVPAALQYSGVSSYLQALVTFSLLGCTLMTIIVIIIFLIFFRWKRQMCD